MSMGTPLKFNLPEGWTVRKVVTALARDWLRPFRTEPAVKAARWVVQPVVEEPDQNGHPLWEPGISTEEYEERLERHDLRWAVRASVGRGKAIVLARLAMCKDQPSTFQIVCNDASLPETLMDGDKLAELLGGQGTAGTEGLFTALLTDHGFQPAAG